MLYKKTKKNNSDKGFTLFIAITITSTLLLISLGIVSIAVRQAFLSASARDSQYAFYAADTGIECAVYWDVKGTGTGISAFATSTSSIINCNSDPANTTDVSPPKTNPVPNIVGGNNTSVFTMTFLPDPYCAKVTVTKSLLVDGTTQTKIESLGYNTCDVSNPRRVERALRVTY